MKRENTMRRRRVDIVVAMNAFAGQGKIEGIFDFQNEGHPWNINLMYAHDWITPKALAKSIASGTEGLILLSHPSSKIIRTVIRSGIPAVIEASRHETFPESPRCIHIFCDPHSLASEAATHLLSRQTFADFCYVNTREEEIWSIDRGEEFHEILKGRGYNCRITFPRKHNLASELKRLSRPAAVLAANDETAKMVIEACQGISLKVPDDIAVLGVDDDPIVCGFITSVIDVLDHVGTADNALSLGGTAASGYLKRSGGTMTGLLRAASETTGQSAVRNISYGTTVPATLADGELFVLIADGGRS